jgi:hypothetical protein
MRINRINLPFLILTARQRHCARAFPFRTADLNDRFRVQRSNKPIKGMDAVAKARAPFHFAVKAADEEVEVSAEPPWTKLCKTINEILKKRGVPVIHF